MTSEEKSGLADADAAAVAADAAVPPGCLLGVGAKPLLRRPLYTLPQTGWSRRLCVQMAVYCGFIALSVLAGARLVLS
jgi:hypothetical protein